MSTAEISESEAKKLGFKPPVTGRPADPTHTSVVGYFNNNQWPVHVALSELGISLHLANRGEYVLDDRGNKINDPRLEEFVGEYMLSREIAPDGKKVPIRRIVAPDHRPMSENRSFTGTQEFKSDRSGNIAKASMERVTAPVAQPTASNSPITGMTVEQARALGIIKPIIETPINTPDDSTGVPVSGHIQTLEEITPRDAKPGDVRRMQASREQAKKSLKTLQDPENAAQEVQLHTLEESINDAPDPEADAIEEAIRIARAVTQQPVVVPRSVVEERQESVMTPPDLGSDDTEAVEDEVAHGPDASKALPEDTKETAVRPFVDPDSGKSFTHRSLLKRHVERQVKIGKITQERCDEVLKMYPK